MLIFKHFLETVFIGAGRRRIIFGFPFCCFRVCANKVE